MSLFIKRLGAFLIDCLIVSIICSLFSFVLVDNSKINKLAIEFNDSYEAFLKEDINEDVFFNQVEDISYDILRSSSLFFIISIAVNICYFVIYQYKNKQTLGKKLFKIKIDSIDRELNINDFIYRSFIGNMILFNLLNVIILMFLPKDIYLFVNIALINIEFLILFICIVMVIFRKDHRGLHDILGHTKVVNI